MDQVSVYDAALGARTQSLFRDVNERVREINLAFADFVPLGDWVCECADPACAERIGLTGAEYEAVRGDSTTFAVAPTDDHVFEQIEDVIDRSDRYWIVQSRERLRSSPLASIPGGSACADAPPRTPRGLAAA